MGNEEIVKLEVAALVKADPRLEVARRTLAPTATDAEFALWCYDCQRQGVHPLDRLIHFTKRKDRKTGLERYTPITSIDLFRSRADQSGDYAGNDDYVFDNEEKPRKASATVYRIVNGQRVGFTSSARWDQYYPGDALGFMWNKMPHVMLGKCAEALALRKAFPRRLAGMYIKEEMEQAGYMTGPFHTAEEMREILPDSEPVTIAPEDESQEVADEENGGYPDVGPPADLPSEASRTQNPPRQSRWTPENKKWLETAELVKKQLGATKYYGVLGAYGFSHADEVTDRPTQKQIYKEWLGLLTKGEDEAGAAVAV